MRKLSKILAFFIVFVYVVTAFSFSLAAAEEDYQNLLGNQNVCKPSEAGELQVVEKAGQMTLVDQNSKLIQLRGMSTHGLQWFGESVNSNAFATLANDWESNVIRLALYIGETGYATDPSQKDLVYQGIDFAMEHDMYVIVDWHVHAPGDPNEEIYSGAYDFFEEIADHYKDDPKFYYILWELCNEPSTNSSGGEGVTNDEAGWQTVKQYAEPIVEMLRTKGDNIIIVGSPNWSQRPDLAADDPIDADNIVYAVHFYTGTHMPSEDSVAGDNVMSNTRYALENGVAVFASEWGTSEASGNNGPFLEEANIWLDFLNENNISWCNWSLTNKNETSGSFTPYIMGVSEATLLDSGSDQLWKMIELSVSGEYVRARIKGIAYEPIDRTTGGAFSEVAWTFDDGTSQGFVINRDSPIGNVELSNIDNSLLISNLVDSIDVSETNYWANVRVSSEDFSPELDIYGCDTMTLEVIVTEKTVVSIAAVPQADKHGWTNPKSSVTAGLSDFKEQEDGTFKAVMTFTNSEAPNISKIADDVNGSILTNIVLFVGAKNGGDIRIDNITFSGSGTPPPPAAHHDELGIAVLPSDFEDMTRQGWTWSPDSGVNSNITIEEANGSNALSFEYAYPDVKPTDNWASAPRLDLWIEPLIRGDNDYVVFDFYIDCDQATTGTIAISGAFQPPDVGYWVQIMESYNIELSEMENLEKTDDGLYHYFVVLDFRSIADIEDETVLRNMLIIIGDIESDFAGRVYVDNVQLVTEEGLELLSTPVATPTPVPTEAPEPVEETEQEDGGFKNWMLIPIIGGVVLIAGGAVTFVILKKKKAPKDS